MVRIRITLVMCRRYICILGGLAGMTMDVAPVLEKFNGQESETALETWSI